jgi:hypothetical protein
MFKDFDIRNRTTHELHTTTRIVKTVGRKTKKKLVRAARMQPRCDPASMPPA